MINKRTWAEFRENGLLWFINMILHTFGWAIVVSIDDDGNICEAYPARVKFRGFNEMTNSNGYIAISKYMKDNSTALLNEAEEE